MTRSNLEKLSIALVLPLLPAVLGMGCDSSHAGLKTAVDSAVGAGSGGTAGQVKTSTDGPNDTSGRTGATGAGGAIGADGAVTVGGTAGGTMVIGDTAGASGALGISDTGGTGGQSTTVMQLPAEAVPVCTYVESGPEHIVSVYRDVAKTNYYLVSSASPAIIVHPIWTPARRVLVDRVDSYEYLYAQVLSGGIIQFVDATNSFDEVCQDQGPSRSFSSSCSEDGIQITELFKDSTLHMLFNRPDGSVYHGDIDSFWVLGAGSAIINFYTAAPGTTIHSLSLSYSQASKTPMGTQIVAISEPPHSVGTISFTDLDNHQVTVDLTAYIEVVDTPSTRH